MSAEINDGGSAFPILPPICSDGHPPAGYPYPDPGMTLRDWFAGKALQGMMSNPVLLKSNGEFRKSNFKTCYECADAMIAAREVKP